FNVTDILSAAQAEATTKQEAAAELEKSLLKSQDKYSQSQDRLLMSQEDIRIQLVRRVQAVDKYDETVGVLRADLQTSRLLASQKSSELNQLQGEGKRDKQGWELGTQATASAMNTLRESLKDLGNKNTDLVKNNSSVKQARSLLKAAQLHAQSRDLDHSQGNRVLTLQTEDLLFRLEVFNPHYLYGLCVFNPHYLYGLCALNPHYL
ncbi:hypothetical protein B484DRAFT_255959, partial [Ochromonadaceae sp. CCMP2298]